MKKEDDYRLNILLLIAALALFGYTLFSLFYQPPPTGQATTQTVTVTLEVLSSAVTPANVTNLTGGSLSGGAAAKKGDLTFTASPSLLKESLEEKTPYTREIRVKNTGDLTQQFEITANKKFISFSKQSFTLSPHEEQALTLTIEPLSPGLKTAIITISTTFSEMKIPVILDIQSKDATFSLQMSIPSAFIRVQPESDIFTTLNIANLNGGFIDLHFAVINAASKILYEERENIKVTNSITIDKTLHLPSYLKPGTYALGIIVNYKGTTRTTSSLFTITSTDQQTTPSVEQPSPPSTKATILLIIICVFIIHAIMARKIKKSTL